MPPRPLPPHASDNRGFSLIEVAIAVSILAVCLVALIGLLPAGMSNFRKAMDTTTTSQIAQRILHDMEQAEFDEVIDYDGLKNGGNLDSNGRPKTHFSFRAPKIGSANSGTKGLRYFDDQGVELVSSNGTTLSLEQKRSAVYTVNIRIIPRAEIPAKNNFGGAVAQVTVQVARNPSSKDIPFVSGAPGDPNVPERNLFQKTSGIQIYTYHSLIGKNEGK